MTQIISLSDRAAERIKEIMSKDQNSLGVRVGVKSGGCAGMAYIMEYAKEKKPNDEMIEDKGVKVFIDPAAVMYLLGTQMDYKKDKFSSSFVFNNPNEKSTEISVAVEHLQQIPHRILIRQRQNTNADPLTLDFIE